MNALESIIIMGADTAATRENMDLFETMIVFYMGGIGNVVKFSREAVSVG